MLQGYDAGEIDRLIVEYERLRERLRGFTFDEVEKSDDFGRLVRLQDRLVIIVTDLQQIGGIAERIRDVIRPSEAEVRMYPIYSMLADERDTRTANYLYGRQK